MEARALRIQADPQRSCHPLRRHERCLDLATALLHEPEIVLATNPRPVLTLTSCSAPRANARPYGTVREAPTPDRDTHIGEDLEHRLCDGTHVDIERLDRWRRALQSRTEKV